MGSIFGSPSKRLPSALGAVQDRSGKSRSEFFLIFGPEMFPFSNPGAVPGMIFRGFCTKIHQISKTTASEAPESSALPKKPYFPYLICPERVPKRDPKRGPLPEKVFFVSCGFGVDLGGPVWPFLKFLRIFWGPPGAPKSDPKPKKTEK